MVRLYNSLTRTVEEFVPREGTKVNMFVCGPTVYGLVHIGNARTFTIFDTVARWLRHSGFDVTYVQNITDVDDKIIHTAVAEGTTWNVIADRFSAAFLEDMHALGNTGVSRYARATEHIPEVIKQVKVLIGKGNVYRIDDDGWYFDLSTFSDYGKLSGRTALQAEDAVSRIDDSSKKKNAGDFCVWKFSKPGEPVWEDAQLGSGRPGWHIEDTAITEDIFGPQYDLHGGGADLKFPHHEAEIAQQEAASGLVPFVKYWMHSGFLQMSAQKMSKSLGNLETLRDVLKRYPPQAVRFFLLSAHYRAPLDFSQQGLDAAAAAVQRIGELLSRLENAPSGDDHDGLIAAAVDEAEAALAEAMEDDFNTPAAFASVFTLVSSLNAIISKSPPGTQSLHRIVGFFRQISACFGIVPELRKEFPRDVRSLLDQRQSARERKDYTESDRIRDLLASKGYAVDDTPYGPLVKEKRSGA